VLAPLSTARSMRPAVTSWFRAIRVTIERSDANGSTTTRGCWGAMRVGEEAKEKEREELREERDAMARIARRLERERQERRVLKAKVKTACSPSIGFIGRRRALRSTRPVRINCSWNIPSRTDGPHHDRGATEPPAGHHHRAVTAEPWHAVTSACPRRPLRAWTQRLKRRARGAGFQSLRTMCGSRIGGWSLPCVMSD
jgi:hypothetical protein